MSDIVEQPAPEVDSAPGPAETNEQDTGLLAQPQETPELLIEQPPEPELVDIEYEGKSFKAPPEAKDAFLRYADYTRKTQEVADQRREIEGRAQQLQTLEKLHGEVIEHLADVRAIDKRATQLQQALSQVNYSQLTPEQQPQILAAQAELAQLQAARGQLGNLIAQKQQQKQLAERQDTATKASKAEAFIKREIKDWSPQKDLELANYAKGIGVNPQRLGAFMLDEPAIALVVDKANKYDQLVKKQLAAKPPAAPAQPIARVTPKESPAVKDPDKMNPDEWRKWREEQLAAQRKKR